MRSTTRAWRVTSPSSPVRGEFQLIETMAEETAALVLARSARVVRVRIEIRKPAAVPAAACAFVRVERARS